MENKIYIGNLVSFVDTEYFVKLMIVKENVLLYKISNNSYIDVTDIEESEIPNIKINNLDETKCFSNLPVHKIFVDENSLSLYKVKTYKLVR